MTTIVPDGFTCSYCGHVFKRERNFEKHQCSEMIRSQQLKSAAGVTAFNCYCKWLQYTKKKAVINKQTFGTSRYFAAFFKFVEWKRQVKIPDVDQFIRLMARYQYDPYMWTHDQVYSRYIEFIDRTSTVDDHILTTYKTIQQVAKAAEVEKADIFSVLELHMVMDYVRARKLSPWVLIKMKSFTTFYSNLNESQRLALMDVIRPKFWGEIIASKPEDTQLIVDFLKRVGL